MFILQNKQDKTAAEGSWNYGSSSSVHILPLIPFLVFYVGELPELGAPGYS